MHIIIKYCCSKDNTESISFVVIIVNLNMFKPLNPYELVCKFILKLFSKIKIYVLHIFKILVIYFSVCIENVLQI